MGDNKVDRYIALLAFVIVLCITLFCQSCSTIKEVPVEVVKEKVVYPKSYWWMIGSLIGILLAITFFIASRMKSFL